MIINDLLAISQLLFNKNWWVHVIVTPEVNRITVFNKGTWNGLKGKIPHGGQTDPNSIVGLNLEWKKAQKKEIKNNTSLIINKIIPTIKPLNTTLECNPWKLLSRITSRHHNNEIIITNDNELNNKSISKNENILIKPLTTPKVPNPINKGHGDIFTIW